MKVIFHLAAFSKYCSFIFTYTPKPVVLDHVWMQVSWGCKQQAVTGPTVKFFWSFFYDDVVSLFLIGYMTSSIFTSLVSLIPHHVHISLPLH